MLAERPLPGDLDDRLASLVRAWSADPDLAAIYLFGSRAEGRGGRRSDVDLAVTLREGLDADARWQKRLGFLEDACRHLGTDAVDLVVLEEVPAPLGHRILKHGRLLSDQVPPRRAGVAEGILRRYLDEAYLRRVLDDGLAERLRERRFAVDATVVRRRLRAMERSLRILRTLRSLGRSAFLSDEAVQDRAERHAQLLAQGCADVALHILAGTGASAPETYAEALNALAETGVIPARLGAELAEAIRLRNILVHGYLDVDHGRLFDELDWIDRTEEFAAAVEDWIEQHADH